MIFLLLLELSILLAEVSNTTDLEWNVHHPFYIHLSESTNQILAEVLLDGGNYDTWSKEVKRSLGSMNKLYYIYEFHSMPKPNFGDKLYAALRQANYMVIT